MHLLTGIPTLPRPQPHQPLTGAALHGHAGYCVAAARRESIVDLRPLRVGEKAAGLWIAPYIGYAGRLSPADAGVFVVKPSAWGTLRVN